MTWWEGPQTLRPHPSKFGSHKFLFNNKVLCKCRFKFFNVTWPRAHKVTGVGVWGSPTLNHDPAKFGVHWYCGNIRFFICHVIKRSHDLVSLLPLSQLTTLPSLVAVGAVEMQIPGFSFVTRPHALKFKWLGVGSSHFKSLPCQFDSPRSHGKGDLMKHSPRHYYSYHFFIQSSLYNNF